MKAYSYLRFSTPDQAKGDSYRRQTSMAKEYCLRHGLELDESLTFQDLGVSAYRGANAETGKLAEFRAAVQEGIVPAGSYLLVEGLDRLSRLVPMKALLILYEITNLDITIVTLNDGRAYTKENINNDGGMSLIVALMVFIRANEESATKGRRVAAAWQEKRRKFVSDPSVSYTRQLPFWLKTRWETNDHVEAVRDIYRLYADGLGNERIRNYLDKTYKPIRSKSWPPTLIKKVLLNRAVEGHLKVNTGELLENVFPVVVDPVLVAKVRAIQATTTRAGRALTTIDRPGTKTSGQGTLAGTKVHPFAGLLKCTCGASAWRVNKGDGLEYLVCSSAKLRRGCLYRSFPYREALALLSEVTHPDLENDDVISATSIEWELSDLASEAYELLKLNRSSLAAQKAWEDAEKALKVHREEVEALMRSISGAGRTAFEEALGDFFNGKKRTNAILRQLFKSGTVNFQTRTMTLTTHAGKEVYLEKPFEPDAF